MVMRGVRVVLATLAVGLLGGAARAGVYDSADPPPRFPPLLFSYKDVRLVLDPLRVASTTAVRPRQPGEPARLYEQQAAELESRPAAGLSTPERIDLGACYIRLGRFNDALRVLSAGDQDHFMVLANLAAAYDNLGELERAVGYEEQALAVWPSIQPGWNRDELVWFRRAESFYLKLLQLRLREGRANPAVKRWDTMDALFGAPRPAGAEYEAQMQPWKMWGDLPPDGYALVSQLLIWSPNDDRLYWQLGELLNSYGYVQDALDVFNELIDTRNESTVRELMRHRLDLKDALAVYGALSKTYGDEGGTARFQRDSHYLMLDIAPPLLLAPPGAGDASNAVAAAGVGVAYGLQEQQQTGAGGPAPPGRRPGWWPDWQAIFIGFAGGLIVATLAALQIMEWRKRRRHAPPAAETPPSSRTEPAVHDAGAFRSDDPSAPDRVEGTP